MCRRTALTGRRDQGDDEEEDEDAERTAALQTIMDHQDPRSRVKGFNERAPVKCPCCLGMWTSPQITPEFEAAEQARLDGMSDTARENYVWVRSESHHGAMLLQSPVFFVDLKRLGSSHLRRRTNTPQNNILATLMTMPFDRDVA